MKTIDTEATKYVKIRTSFMDSLILLFLSVVIAFCIRINNKIDSISEATTRNTIDIEWMKRRGINNDKSDGRTSFFLKPEEIKLKNF